MHKDAALDNQSDLQNTAIISIFAPTKNKQENGRKHYIYND